MLLLQFGLAVPATFGSIAEGGREEAWTWSSIRGSTHRIDFVALPQEWLAGATWAGVLRDVDLVRGVSLDHRVTAVRVLCRSEFRSATAVV